MPEVIKPADALHEPSRWTMLKVSIADRVRHGKEKKQQVDHKASISKKEVKKAVPKSSNTSEKKSAPTAKLVSKESPVSKVVKKPTQEPKRPIDQILVGSWNAIKQIPEKQGKGIVNIYDKLRFPKLTTEEQKIKDKIHVFLKKYQKEIGWGVTGVEAAAVTYGVVKGFQYLKRLKLRKRMSNRGDGIVHSVGAMDNDSLPASGFAEVLLKELLKNESNAVKRSVRGVQKFMKNPVGHEQDFNELPADFAENLPVFAARFYSFAEKQNVAKMVNPLTDYDAQQWSLFELMKQFLDMEIAGVGSAEELGVPNKDLLIAKLEALLTGRVLGSFGYPGLEELGVRFKPNPLA